MRFQTQTPLDLSTSFANQNGCAQDITPLSRRVWLSKVGLTLASAGVLSTTTLTSIVISPRSTTAAESPEPYRRPADRIFRGHTDTVFSAIFSPDGSRILSASADQTAVLRDTATGKIEQVFRSKTSEPIVKAQFSLGSRSVITQTSNHITTKWSLTGEKLNEFRGQVGQVDRPIAVNPVDGREVTTFGRNDDIVIINIETGEQTARCVGHRAPVTSLDFSEDGKKLLSGSLDETVIVWNFPLREFPDSPPVLSRLNTIDNYSEVLAAKFSADGQRVLIGLADHTVVLRDLMFNQKLESFFIPNAEIRSVAFSRDGKKILVAAGTMILLWNLPDYVSTY